MSVGNKNYQTSPEQLKRESEAAQELAAFLAESKDRIGQKCPECGSIGSLEEVDGQLRCIDCDEVVAAKTKLAGFGRR